MPIERLLEPRSIAAFGGANAQEVIRQSDRMGYKGEIWPVHPKKTEILGRRVYRSVEDLPARCGWRDLLCHWLYRGRR
jgi:acetyl-CoA synthetase